MVGAIAVAAAVLATPASGSSLSCDGAARSRRRRRSGAAHQLREARRVARLERGRGPGARPARAQPRRPSLGPRRRRRRSHPRRPDRAVAADVHGIPVLYGEVVLGFSDRRGNALGAQQRDRRAPAIAPRADRPRAGTAHRRRGDRRRHRASRRAHRRAGRSIPAAPRACSPGMSSCRDRVAAGGLERDRRRPHRARSSTPGTRSPTPTRPRSRPEPGAGGRHLRGLRRRQRRRYSAALTDARRTGFTLTRLNPSLDTLKGDFADLTATGIDRTRNPALHAGRRHSATRDYDFMRGADPLRGGERLRRDHRRPEQDSVARLHRRATTARSPVRRPHDPQRQLVTTSTLTTDADVRRRAASTTRRTRTSSCTSTGTRSRTTRCRASAPATSRAPSARASATSSPGCTTSCTATPTYQQRAATASAEWDAVSYNAFVGAERRQRLPALDRRHRTSSTGSDIGSYAGTPTEVHDDGRFWSAGDDLHLRGPRRDARRARQGAEARPRLTTQSLVADRRTTTPSRSQWRARGRLRPEPVRRAPTSS